MPQQFNLKGKRIKNNMSRYDQMFRQVYSRFASQPPKKAKAVASYLKAERQPHDLPLDQAIRHKLDISQISDSYLPYHVEGYWHQWWNHQKLYHADPAKVLSGQKAPFVMCFPPPNVTGYLHIGHALTCSIQDAISRYQRMLGKEVCFLPGLDHAGIATQSVVEKELMKNEQKRKHDIGREEFLKRVWEWKEKHGNGIFDQLTRMGCSLDWDRLVFTMDDKLTRAVKASFVKLHEKGLIYRSSRLVNWSCLLKTAIADIEVEYEDIPGNHVMTVPGHTGKYTFGVMIHFAYKVKDSAEEIVVATTRIETMLGDVAVAVNSKDPRYQHLIGKQLVHPFDPTREIKVIVDDTLVDMAFGTGAVKITPAHDPNDYECGKRHHLEEINVFTDDGKINEKGGEFSGMLRFDCRNSITKRLEELGLLRGQTPNPMRLGFCQRSKDVVEPLIRPQWWISCQEISKRMINAAQTGELVIRPKQHIHTWNRWLQGIRDWCVSRQLWWGHRIPAYQISLDGEWLDSGMQDSWVVAADQKQALEKAVGKYPHRKVEVRQDEDVLDTWYSSGLFPFSVFGWPEETPELQAFFPNTLLETGHDIIFFWVARMVMMSYWLTDRLPFKYVYLHSIVCDEDGRKMSKSLGNVINPLEIVDGTTLQSLVEKIEGSLLPKAEKSKSIEKMQKKLPEGIPECGADALRFGLMAYMVQSGSINLNINTVISHRQFCNKIWNTVKFGRLFIPATHSYTVPSDPASLSFLNRWILNCLTKACQDINSHFQSFVLGQITIAFRQFWLYELCDVYLEAVKPVFKSGSQADQDEARNTLLCCLETGLRLLHPIMPFLTEQLYQKLPQFPGKPLSISIASYPAGVFPHPEPHILEQFDIINKIAGSFRSITACFNVPQHVRPQAFIILSEAQAHHAGNLGLISVLGKTSGLTAIDSEDKLPAGCASAVVEGCRVYLAIKQFIDPKKEIERLHKKILQQDGFIANVQKKTSIKDYATKVPEKVQNENAEALHKYQQEKLILVETLRKLQKM